MILLPEGTIRRIGVEYGVHKMRIELAMIVSSRGLGDLGRRAARPAAPPEAYPTPRGAGP